MHGCEETLRRETGERFSFFHPSLPKYREELKNRRNEEGGSGAAGKPSWHGTGRQHAGRQRAGSVQAVYRQRAGSVQAAVCLS